MELLRNINSNISKISFDDNVSVERETGRIDIYIYDDKHGIIIENKINNAPDQKDQLARYVKFAEGKHGNHDKDFLVAVVYIPPVNTVGKEPPLQEYSEKYKTITDKIGKKLVVLPVLERMGNNKDIVHGFLDEIVKIPANETARVFIEQYSNLLKGLGENSMTNLSKRKIIEAIFSDYEMVEIANEIGEMWSDKKTGKGQLLGEILCEKLLLKEELKFKTFPDDEFCIGKEVGNGIVCCIWSWSEVDRHISIGFLNSGGQSIPEKIKQKLESILKEDEFSNYFLKVEEEGHVISRSFNYDSYKKPLSDVVDFLADKFVKLENKVKALK
jgi:hypothetical protein